MMCQLCEERCASASKMVDELIGLQEDYRRDNPDLTQSQRITAFGNAWLHDMQFPENTPMGTITSVQEAVLFLAITVERIMNMKREGVPQ